MVKQETGVFSTVILHIDMDAFYASVEVLDNPDLAGKPVAVGGVSGRGVVAAASYEARKFGVRSAMPMFMALEKCPELLVVRPRKERYKKVSRRLMEILGGFSPLVEKVSIDEAFMDVSGCGRLWGTPEEIAVEIKKKIARETSLTCSVGGAPLKFLAKIASDMDKPDGLTIISQKMLRDFIEDLPVKKVPGVGPQTEAVLERLGVKTLGDVSLLSEAYLSKKLGKFGIRLKELSMGIDRSKVVPFAPVKSVSAEETLAFDTADIRILKKYLLEQAEDVARQLRGHGLKARTVSVKIKTSDFVQSTKSRTLKKPSHSSKVLYYEGCLLLEAFSISGKLRLIGLGASGLTNEKRPVQLEFFGDDDAKDDNWEKVDRAADAIAERFGKDILRRAVLKEP